MLRLATLPLLITAALAVSGIFQAQSRTYPETRKLLLKVERSPANSSLKKLFEEEDARRPDLMKALDDPDPNVSLNAQTVIMYSADPRGLAELEQWREYRRKSKGEIWASPIELLSEVKYLGGEDRDLAKLASEFVLNDAHLNTRDIFAEVIAYNKHSKTALVEVIVGNVFTDGRHLVVRRENGKWRLLSQSIVWRS